MCKIYVMIESATQLYIWLFAMSFIKARFYLFGKNAGSSFRALIDDRELCGSNGASVFRAQAPCLRTFVLRRV